MKKIISLLVCATMLTMLAPLGAMAASNIVTYTEDFTTGETVLNEGVIKTSEPNAEIGTISVADEGPLFTQDFTNVTSDSLLTDKGGSSYDNSDLTITTTAATSEYYYDLSSITSTRNDYSVEFDLSVSTGNVDLGLRYQVRIGADGYQTRNESSAGSYNTKVTMDFTTAKKVKFVVSNKTSDKVANVSLYIEGDLVQENMPIPLNSSDKEVSYGTLNKLRIDSKKAQTITIDNIVVKGTPIDGNIIAMEKTGTGAVQNITIEPSVADICNAKNYTLEFDFVPVGFNGSGQIMLAMGAKYTLQANNAGSSISKLSVNDSTSVNMSSADAFTAMGTKSAVKISVENGSLVSLAINGNEIATDSAASGEGWSFDKLRIQLNKNTTGTLYLDNFKLTLLDDYLLSSSHDGEKFNVNYYVKDAAKLYKASYGSDGMLKGVTIDTLAASATESITVAPITAASDISSMKFFIWNNNLVPLVNSASSEVAE